MRKKERILALLAGGLLAFPSWVLAGCIYMGPEAVYTTMNKGHAGFEGITPRLILGYGDALTGSFYLAGEIFGGLKTISIRNHPSKVLSLRTTYQYGASIIPGYIFDNVFMGYARFGVLSTHFENIENGTTKQGWTGGLGLEAALTPSWSIRGEYDYTKYMKINTIGHIYAGQFILGLKYTFS